MKEIILSYIIKAAYYGLQAALDDGLVEELRALVEKAFDFEMSGPEKKAAVLKELHDIGGVLSKAVQEMAGFFLSAMIDIIVAKAKLDRGEKIVAE